MFTAIKTFFWPGKNEIVKFNQLKWYRGFNFWYMIFVVISLMILEVMARLCIDLIYSSKISNTMFFVSMAVSAPMGSIFFLYLLYRRYVWAYIGLGLSYFWFDYLIMGKYFLVEEAYGFIFLYILGLLAVRINWYYRQVHPVTTKQLKKDCIIALLLMELCFYISWGL